MLNHTVFPQSTGHLDLGYPRRDTRIDEGRTRFDSSQGSPIRTATLPSKPEPGRLPHPPRVVHPVPEYVWDIIDGAAVSVLPCLVNQYNCPRGEFRALIDRTRARNGDRVDKALAKEAYELALAMGVEAIRRRHEITDTATSIDNMRRTLNDTFKEAFNGAPRSPTR